MRQAGRSFAAYRKLRERYGILELAKTPDLCAEVTLMPVRELGVDAAVLFADIMLPLEPMGVGLRIEPEVGPVIDRPIRSAADVAALGPFDPAEMSFTLDAIRLVRGELDGAAGVIGFSGAPFTLACYLIEGRRSRDFATAKAFMYREPAAWHDLMERLSTMVVAYLRAQVDAGADVVQLFDSWVGGLGPADYREFVQPHVARIFAAVRDVPTIHFGTGTAALLELLAEAGGDVIGLDHRVSLADAWRLVGHDRGVQGNLDPARLLGGLGGDTSVVLWPSSTRRPVGPATSSISATACCPRPTPTCCAGSLPWSTSSLLGPISSPRSSRERLGAARRAAHDLRLAGLA